MPTWKAIGLVSAVCLISSCGGGGGGSSNPGTSSPALSMTVSPQTLSVSAASNGAAPAASVTITLSSQPPGQLYVGTQDSQGLVSNVSAATTGTTTAAVTIDFVSPSSLGVGTHTDTLQIGVFSDQAGTKPIGNSPQSVAITYNVTALPAPTIASLNPISATAGAPGFTLTVSGTQLTWNSVVLWNGSARPTTYLSSTQLAVQISPSDIAVVGSVSVTVDNGASAGGVSTAATFNVQAPVFGITSLSPASAPVGGPAFTLTVNGAQFDSNAIVQWNGVARTTIFVSSTQLTAQIGAADIASANTASITVLNPAGLGGTSNALPFHIGEPDAVAFQVDPGHSGAVVFSSVSLPAGKLWQVTLDGPPSYPLMAQGMVFLTVPISGGSELLALNQATGGIVWGPIMIGGASSAAYDSGKILVTSASGSLGAMIQAFDASSGNHLWSSTLPGQYSFNAMPSALNGKVYTTESGGGTTTYAFDESNGALLWSQLTDAGSYGGAAVTTDGVFVAGPQENYVFDPQTGSLKWSYLLGGDGGGGALPVVSGGLAFMPDGFGTYNGQVFNASSGALMGSYVADCPPAITSTNGFFLQQGTLRGLKLSNNQILWSFAGDGTLTTSPIVVNGYVFIGASSGNLYGLDATTGAQVWTQSLGAAIPGGATWAHGLPFSGLNAGDGLLVVPAGNTLTAFKLQ